MTDSETIQTQIEGFELLIRQASIIYMLPLEEWRDGLNRADTVVPFLDPTLYLQASRNPKVRFIRDVIDAAIPLKAVIEKARKNPGLMLELAKEMGCE